MSHIKRRDFINGSAVAIAGSVAGPGDSVAIGRQPHGRITIANSDSAPAADAIEAMRMGYRAVKEISST